MKTNTFFAFILGVLLMITMNPNTAIAAGNDFQYTDQINQVFEQAKQQYKSGLDQSKQGFEQAQEQYKQSMEQLNQRFKKAQKNMNKV